MRSLLIILLLAPLTIKAQNSALLHEQQLKGAYQKAYPACVKAYGVDCPPACKTVRSLALLL